MRELIEFLLPFSLLVDDRFLFLPFGFERDRFFFQIRQFFLELLQSLLAGRIFFFLERLPLHFMLHDLALDHVDLRRHGIELDLQTRRRFIDEIDRLIRQETDRVM